MVPARTCESIDEEELLNVIGIAKRHSPLIKYRPSSFTFVTL